MSPRDRALHAKNAIAFFAKHARLSQSADFAFAASKRTAKTEGFLREERLNSVGLRKRRDFYGKKGIFLVGARIARPFQCETNFLTVLWGSEAARGE